MSYSLRFHKLIQQDFSNAYEWYENKSQGLGERFIEAVKLKLDNICHLPEANSEKYRKGFREASVDTFPFVIVYKIMPSQTIFVSAIHHVKNIQETSIVNLDAHIHQSLNHFYCYGP